MCVPGVFGDQWIFFKYEKFGDQQELSGFVEFLGFIKSIQTKQKRSILR